MKSLLPCVMLSLAAAVAAGSRPNVIVILADDLGWKDLGCQGGAGFRTPRIDRLAAEGARFTNAYAMQSCSPSRAALLSGQYAPRTGVFMVGPSDQGPARLRKLIPVPNREELPLETVTIAETLAAAGYVTANIGKWHLGENESHYPPAQGFRINIGGYREGTPPSYFSPYGIPTLEDGPPGEYLTDRLTDEALRFIEANRGLPFFLYLPHYAVHVPIQAKPELEAEFRDHANPAYAAMVASLDESVGRIHDALVRLKLLENTCIVLVSDNGGQTGVTSQPPLREGKGWLYEGGIRVPMIIRAPDSARPSRGAVCQQPVHLVDLYPTLLEWTNTPPPPRVPLDGVSLAALVRDPAAPPGRDALFWHFPGYQKTGGPKFRIRPSSVIRQGDWKLIESFENGVIELYDLSNDIGETRNLAAELPETVELLKSRLARWRADIGAPVPTGRNPAYEP